MLELRFRASRLELAGLLICYVVAQAVVVQAGPLVAVLMTPVLAVVCVSRAAEVLLLGNRSLQQLTLRADGSAWLHTHGGLLPVRLRRVVYRSGWLTILDFNSRAMNQAPDSRRAAWPWRLTGPWRVMILPDSIDPADQRRLAHYLHSLPQPPGR